MLLSHCPGAHDPNSMKQYGIVFAELLPVYADIISHDTDLSSGVD